MKYRFFLPEPFSVSQVLSLSREESEHCIRVLRLKENESVVVFDGKGRIGTASIVEITKKSVRVQIDSLEMLEPLQSIELVFAIPKAKALDFIIHRCAELGVLSLQPVSTEFSLNKSEFNSDRWTSVLIEVAKQSQSAFVAQLRQPLTLLEWLNQRSRQIPLFFCDENCRSVNVTEDRVERQPGLVSVQVLVGAEGGFSDKERSLVRVQSPKLLSLGAHRLRAETAALVALTLLKKELGEI